MRRVIVPMLTGGRASHDMLDDDFAYVVGLGLVRAHAGRYEIANPIYAEVLPRALTYSQQLQFDLEPAAFMRADGTLDVPKLMADDDRVARPAARHRGQAAARDRDRGRRSSRWCGTSTTRGSPRAGW